MPCLPFGLLGVKTQQLLVQQVFMRWPVVLAAVAPAVVAVVVVVVPAALVVAAAALVALAAALVALAAVVADPGSRELACYQPAELREPACWSQQPSASPPAA